MDKTPFEIRTKHGKKIAEGIWVLGDRCAHCGYAIGGEMCLALAAPYHCHLHEACYPHFNYNNRWPHKFVMHEYTSDPLQLE